MKLKESMIIRNSNRVNWFVIMETIREGKFWYYFAINVVKWRVKEKRLKNKIRKREINEEENSEKEISTKSVEI